MVRASFPASLIRRLEAALRRQRGGAIVWCASMSAMGEMAMPGGWTMSMRGCQCGQTWPGAAASFLAVWVVTMVAMLPSYVPMLWRYRQAVGGTGGTRLAR
jgi:predicted metal-binding membrane protein